MAILKNIKNKLVDFFTEPAMDDKSKDADGENYTDTDTTEIGEEDLLTEVDLIKRKPHEDKVKDEEYWWCFAGHPPSDIKPLFEEIDGEKLCADLNNRIEKNEFPVIEIPDNIMKTLRILNNPEFDYNEVSNLIHHSPAMAGEFIRVINSSLYSRGTIINDLKLALPRLGKENIKAMLYMYSAKVGFSPKSIFYELAEEIVEHSYATALIASYMSQRYFPDPDSAFLAGLLHDIGKLGILKAISESFKLPRKVADEEVSMELFDNIMPRLHEKAGKFLAANWKVDPNIIMTIEHHHDFAEYGFMEDEQMAYHLSALVNLSDTMARILGRGHRIDKTNIFSLPATIDLSIDRTLETVKFLDNIPKIVAFKTAEEK